ncbi:hypothetical protein C6P46_001883 [Rhodotorula mucilaginosa]|uniref:Uncharacterized protein n=1 Tax=Rhodotorula mucilaginosa TaxID=5537 RepID=A0A9P6W6Q0_RHOMI|nr:hypothetical protein C6P46_001883 [Rhodotorula mucilaginosa]
MRSCLPSLALVGVLFALLSSVAVSGGKTGIAIITQQRVRVGEAIKLQWQGGTPPYILKVILNNTVVSQNEGWTGNSVQWRSTEEQVPVGTKIKIRITDSEGQMVVSDVTRVVPASDSGDEYAGKFEPVYEHGMDDPSSEKDTKDRKTFGLEFGLGPGGMTLGIGRGPATSSATPTSEAGAEEPVPTGQPDWDASGVAGDTLLPPTETGAAATGASSELPLITATDATAADTATAAATAAVTSDSDNSAVMDSGASATSSADDAASSSSSTSDSTTEGGTSNTALYIGIAVVVLLLLGGLGGFFYWRHRKQAADDEDAAANGKKRNRSAKKSGHGSGTSEDDEENLVGGHPDKDDYYGSSDDGTPAYKAPKSKSKGKSSGSRRSSSAAYRDDVDSDAYGSDGDFTAKSTKSSRRSRA